MSAEDRLSIAIKLLVEVVDGLEPPSIITDSLIKLLKDAQLGIRHNYCSLCSLIGYEPSQEIEYHHVAGRINYPDSIPTCKGCHRSLSILQIKWLTLKPDSKLSSYLFGWSDVFHFLYMETRNHFFCELHTQFVYQAQYYRELCVVH